MSTRVRERRWARARGACHGVVAALCAAFLAAPASSRAQSLTAPPAPRELDPIFLLDVHGAAILPVERSAICPPGYGCVMGAGFGAGVTAEHRAADGVGLLVGYDASLLDAAGIYEVAVVHTLRLGVRWVIDASTRVHPFVEILGGALLVTDPLEARTGGGLLTAAAGAELELTEDVAVSLALELWALSVGSFRTRDGAQRATDFGVSVMSQLRVGLVVLFGDPNH